MNPTEEIKALFSELPSSTQSSLLDTLLQEHELRGKILQDASEEVIIKTMSLLHKCRSL